MKPSAVPAMPFRHRQNGSTTNFPNTQPNVTNNKAVLIFSNADICCKYLGLTGKAIGLSIKDKLQQLTRRSLIGAHRVVQRRKGSLFFRNAKPSLMAFFGLAAM